MEILLRPTKFLEGYVLEQGSEAEAVLARVHGGATGRKLESFMTAGYLDTRVYALYDQIAAMGRFRATSTASTSA